MYDPKFSQKEMYDQYGRSRNTTKKADPKPSRSSGFGGMGPDPAEQFGGSPTKGLGSRPFDRGSTYDEVPTPTPSKPKDPSNIEKVKNKFIDLMKSFGAEDPKEEKVDGKAVYRGPLFRGPINMAAMDARIRDAVDYSKAPPIYYGGIPSEGNMRYDVVPSPTVNPNLQRNAINRIIKNLSPNSKEYKIKRGDTLSEIAQREGVTVDDLAKINNIENINRILAGDTLLIPPPQEVDKVKDLVDSVDPDAQFYQSGVPMDQREFAPEGDYLDNLPRDRELMINTDTPDYNFMAAGSKYTEALKKKEADNYDTIFGNAEIRTTPFKGTKVSDMTLDEVLEFTKLDGKFHKYNKKKGHNTTAVGKYQIVGSTLRDLNSKERGVLKKLGITGSTKFDEKTQDDIASYLAVHRLVDRASSTKESARAELRKEWQGLQKLSDDELDEIIKEIGDEVGKTFYDAADIQYVDPNPGSSLRPQKRPKGLGEK